MWETSRDESLSNLRNKTWLYVGTEQSWQYLANLIHHFPSFCLLDATNHPVSWSLMDPFGAMAHGYTLPQHRRLDPAVRLSSLDVSHADLLNETWVFGGNEKSGKYLASLIRHFPSVCLLDTVGHPVSWTASDLFGAMGPAYTLPQHWGRGYMGMLNNLMAKRLHALGYPSYGNVATENYRMQRLQERQGFQRQPSLCHFIHRVILHISKYQRGSRVSLYPQKQRGVRWHLKD
ncbi:Glycine N-acyltransferase-like protein 3 [Chelonia mydas]|uniref:Glycine N-acyltransferase-like protein n=1 Tax=Chelonia mydas TaxID=8469 RepID=M7AN53_CHEMY|nr:Glycine N-acyltransferase-like protein 3 [Chelonia mydas]